MDKRSKHLKNKIFTGQSLKVERQKIEPLSDVGQTYNLKKSVHCLKIKKTYFRPVLFNLTNFSLFLLVFLLLPRKIFTDSNCYIELKVNKPGENQILSNEYNANFPINYKYDDGETNELHDKFFNFSSTEKTIKLFWSNCYYFTNFSFMFKGLTTITEVHVNYMFNQYSRHSNLSYMFMDCTNLTKFSCNSDFNEQPTIIDTRSIFYNCTSLKNFSFTDLYFYF